MENATNTINNCKEYSKLKNGEDVLRVADGKKNYKEIAEILDMHPTAVSSLLKKAYEFGLVKKIKSGLYKKVPGVLGYMPKGKKIVEVKDVNQIIRKISKIKGNKNNPINNIPTNSIYSKISNQNDGCYNLLFVTENILRRLVKMVLSKKDKQNWWQNFIPTGIKSDVVFVINKTPYHANKRSDELEYTHLGQLKEIIINNKNWSDFLPYLNEKNKTSFSLTIDKAIPMRNAVAHSIPLKKQDKKEFDVRFTDILKMIK